MSPDTLPRSAEGSPASQTTRAFYLWEVYTGEIHWGGNCEPILDCPPWDMPRTLNGWLGVLHPVDRAGVQDALCRLLADRQPIRLEYRIRRPDGRSLPVVAHAAFVSDATVIGSVARRGSAPVWGPPAPAAADDSIYERSRSDRELIRFFELSEDLMCVAGTDGYFRRVNPHFSQVLGYPAGELLSHPFLDFVHPDDQAGTRAVMALLNQGRSVTQFRNRYLTARGGVRWLEWTARAVPDEGVVFAVARDVTERVDLEQRLRQREARERAILDNTTAVIYVKDRDGRYEFVNERYVRLFGVSLAGVVGKTDAEIFPADFARAFQENDRRVLRTGETVQVDEVVPHPDGPRTYMSVKFPLFDERGRATAVAGISTDVTDRIRAREAEEQMRTARLVQQRLYPASSPAVPGFDVAYRGLSASELCGDYFDLIFRDDRRLVVAVADICGHGLGPAMQMVETRALLRLLLQSADGPDQVVERLNRQLCLDTPESSFVSLFLAEIDVTGRRLTYVGAGHEAYLLRADGRDQRLASTGFPPGVTDAWPSDPPPPTALEPGDLLLVCTDGLIEAMSPAGEPFGGPRLLAAARSLPGRPAAEVVEHLFAEVTGFIGGGPVKDDITLIVLKAA